MCQLLGQRLRMTLTLLASGLAISGCVAPIPFPGGYDWNSRRSDLGDEMSRFIVVGSTTREDVLFELGQADMAGIGEHWLVYESRRSRGGVMIFVYPVPLAPAFEDIEYRQLTIHFDNSGVVERAEFRMLLCKRFTVDKEDPSTDRCFDAAGQEVMRTDLVPRM